MLFRHIFRTRIVPGLYEMNQKYFFGKFVGYVKHAFVYIALIELCTGPHFNNQCTEMNVKLETSVKIVINLSASFMIGGVIVHMVCFVKFILTVFRSNKIK